MSHFRSVVFAACVSVLTAGCAVTPTNGEDSAATSEALTPTQSGIDKYGLQWVKADDGSVVIRADTVINAPIEVVWSLVRDPNGYGTFNKALTAQIDEVKIGATIKLFIRLLGDALPPTESDETVEIFDESLYVASWSRDFGGGQATHRPQVLEVEGTGTHYYTALRLPPSLAWIVKPLLGESIKDAFERFAAGLKSEAELRAQP